MTWVQACAFGSTAQDERIAAILDDPPQPTSMNLTFQCGQRKSQLEPDLGRRIALYLAVRGSAGRWFHNLSGHHLGGLVLNSGKVIGLPAAEYRRKRLPLDDSAHRIQSLCRSRPMQFNLVMAARVFILVACHPTLREGHRTGLPCQEILSR